jgi:methionyl aminopeptidase
VGETTEEARLLVERTHEAMMRGIKAVAPGRPINVIGRVIESYAKRFGYGVVRDFTGHGIGETFHSGLYVPHYDNPRLDVIMEPGMTFTIEPMITLGTHEWDMWPDNWTVVTKDRRWTAQFEHTLVVTEDGSEILTLP